MTPEALFDAIFAGDAGRVREILDAAPELVNVRDGNGDAPLHAAVEALRAPVVRILLERGARPGARNGDGRTGLDLVRDLSEGEARAEIEAMLAT